MSPYRIVAHPADIAVEIEGSDRREFFTAALNALTAVLTGREGESDGVVNHSSDEVKQFPLTASGYDDEERLVAILNELLFKCQVENWFPLDVTKIVFSKDGDIEAQMTGLPDEGGDRLSREVKATTYHNLKIVTEPIWAATVVFDV